VANGVYAPWTEGAALVATDKAIREVLANGPAVPAQLRARTGKSDAAIHGGLHRLKKKGTIVLTQRGKYAMYALAGTAPLHVYAGDAIGRALESGSKTLAELETVTGKKRGELWAALLRKEAKGEVVKAYLINVGHRGRLAAFAAAPAHR
jgi:biotin operon repressor